MTAQAESARPPWPCPRWSREDPHPAHDWDAPVDGASWCPGVADPDAAAESEPRPNVDDIARCLSAGDVEINHGDYPAWDDLRDGGRDQYRQLARYLLARYDITPRTARGDA